MDKNLLESNIYEYKGTVAVCGSCLPQMDARAYKKLKQKTNNIFFTCLESTHMNVVAHKIASILRIGNVRKMIFVTGDNSPHCVQLHYIRNEIEKIMNCNNYILINYVAIDGKLIKITSEQISKSKNLSMQK